MKKYISVILSVFLMLQTTAVVFADDWDDLVKSNDNVTGVYEEIVTDDNTSADSEVSEETVAYQKLSAFGFTPSQTSSQTTLTRSEFVTMAMKAAGVDDSQEISGKIFADVPADHAAARYIEAAYRMGVISGADGIFEPDRAITYNDAIVIAVRILGRDAEAKAKGGYPAGYLQVAASCDLTDGVTSSLSGTASKNALYQIMANTVECDRFAANVGFKNGEALYDTKSDETMLSYYHGIYVQEGTLNAVGPSNILGSAIQAKNTITVGSVNFDGNYEDYIDMLGMNVCAYWREKGAKAELVFMEESDNKVLTLSDADISDYKDGKYHYYDGKTEKKASLAKSPSVMYNGRIIAKESKSYFVPKNGSVKLVDNNRDGNYEVAIVTDTDDIIVAAVSNDSKVIYDRFDADLSASFDDGDPESVRILVNTSGKITYPAMVKSGNIVSVAKSEDGVVVKGIVSILSVKGTIESVRTESDLYVEIDGKSYRVTPKCLERKEKLFTPGSAFSFKLNAFGDIADVVSDESGDGYSYGYVIQKGTSSDSIGAKYGIKLLDESGTIAVHYLKDSLKIDEISCRNVSEQDSALNQGLAQGNVIRFTLNADGLISQIDTAYVSAKEDTDNTLRKIYDSTQPKLHHKTFTFGGSFGEIIPWTTGDTRTFVLYTNETSENKRYRLAQSGQFTNDGEYAPEAYRSGDSFYADVLVRVVTSGTAATAGDKNVYVIEDIRIKDDGDGSVVSLKLSKGNYKKDVTVEGDVFEKRNLEIGDMIRCDESDGQVIGESIVKTFDYGDNKVLESSDETACQNEYFVRLGYVYDVKDDQIQYSVVKGDVDNLKIVKNISDTYAVEKDRFGKVTVTKVSMSDLLTYVACGNDCSEILVHYQYLLPQQMFVIK